MTSKKFIGKIRDLITRLGDDKDSCHEEMDKVLCQALREMCPKCEEGIKMFEEYPKWYA